MLLERREAEHFGQVVAVDTDDGKLRRYMAAQLPRRDDDADRDFVAPRNDRGGGSRGQDWNLLTAGAFISILVPLIVFFSLQRFFVRGLLAGSTKG